MNKTIGKNITARRHQLKMTQEQLAELSNLSVNYISKIERGTTPKISAKNTLSISKKPQRVNGKFTERKSNLQN